MQTTAKEPLSDHWVDLGEEHHRAGRLDEAEAHYRRALDIDPGHPGALYYLANITYADGRAQLAKELILELLQGEPNDAEAWHLLGMIAASEEHLALAVDHFTKAVTIQPAFAPTYFSRGNALRKLGDIDNALENFQRAAALNPAFVEAHRAIGDIFIERKQFDEALQSYRQAISLKSDFKLAYEGIGGILLSQGRWDDAIALYHKAITENAVSALVYVGLGIAYGNKEQHFDAALNYERAISHDSECFLAYFHLGGTLIKLGRFLDAVIAYEKAVQLKPDDMLVLGELASLLLYRVHDFRKAADVYRYWLTIEPKNPVAIHHLAGCTQEFVPVRADDAYVERTFDAFADTFDDTLGKLKYCGPELLANALRRNCGVANKQFAILDAGCGTGAGGPFVAEYASRLVGADLSAGMLAKAAERGVYDELVKAELTEYLHSQSQAFDVVLAADTFIYFGAVEALVAGARYALRDGGYFLFTAESFVASDVEEESPGYRIHPHGRYSHCEPYLQKVLQRSGFDVLAVENGILRYEGGEPAYGLVMSCRVLPAT